MLKLVKWEVTKLLCQKKTWVGILILALFGFLIGFALANFTPPDGVEGFEINIHPLVFPVTIVNSNLGLFIPIFTVLAIAEMFAGEYAGGTLKNLLIRPLGRTRVYGAKLITAYIYILLFVTVSALIGLAVGYTFFDAASPLNLDLGFGVMEFTSVGHVLGWTLAYMLISSVLVFAFAALVGFISTLLDSPAAVIMGSVGYLVGINILQQVGFKYGKYLLNGEHFILATRLLFKPDWSALTTPLLVVGGFLLAGLAAGWYSFRKKQIVL